MTEEKNDKNQGESPNAVLQKMLEGFRESLSDAERAQFEQGSPEDPFLQDAAEGLHGMENRQDLHKVISSLNQQLHHHLAHNKSNRRKKDLRYGEWIYWSIGLILLLALAAFLVLRLLLKH